MVVILVPFFAPILQIIRYGLVYQGTYINSEVYSENIFGYIIYFFKQIHVSSFEGQWLAVFLEKISFRDFLFGVNFLSLLEICLVIYQDLFGIQSLMILELLKFKNF